MSIPTIRRYTSAPNEGTSAPNDIEVTELYGLLDLEYDSERATLGISLQM